MTWEGAEQLVKHLARFCRLKNQECVVTVNSLTLQVEKLQLAILQGSAQL